MLVLVTQDPKAHTITESCRKVANFSQFVVTFTIPQIFTSGMAGREKIILNKCIQSAGVHKQGCIIPAKFTMIRSAFR